VSRLINSAIACRDLKSSLDFYCNGIGLVMISDNEFQSPFAPLMGVTDGFPQHQAHLADPSDVGVTMVELVEMKATAGLPVAAGPPFRGPFLVGFQCDYDDVVARLRSLGYDDIRESVLEGSLAAGNTEPMKIGFLRDPDGTVVELVSQNFPAASMRLRKQGFVEELQPWP
jgi:catechol 2,3-dioxygenase-like lactoylglutathione lyase family enzyme